MNTKNKTTAVLEDTKEYLCNYHVLMVFFLK